jgi:2-hydroxychromene-2-carboxylate isomerase
MGDVIRLSERREALRRRGPARQRARSRAEYFFDLACPFTYLAAERVERSFDDVVWRPASSDALRRTSLAGDDVCTAAMRRAAEERAAVLRLPLVWPERFPDPVPAAMRVAAVAADGGRGGAFVLAATRLAFCGGFDLDDPEILAEAAAAAGVVLGDALRAARDGGRDGAIEDAGRALLAAGADRLPALRVGRALYWGEERVGDALIAARFARATAAR